jgi:hypothetical protein
MCAYAPGVTDISGQLRAQGKVAQAQGIAQGISGGYQEYAQNRARNAALQGQNEGLIKAFMQDEETKKYAPEGVEQFIEKTIKNGGLSLSDNIRFNGMLNSALATKGHIQDQRLKAQEGAMREQQLKASQQVMVQQQRDQEALAKSLAQFMPPDDTAEAPAFDPARFLQIYSKSGGSPQSIERVDAVLKMLGPQRSPMFDVEKIRSADEKGNPIEIAVDKRTMREVARGPISQPQRPVLSPEEEAAKQELLQRGESAHKFNEGLLEAGKAASSNIASYDRAVKLLDTVRTGTAADAELMVRRAAETAGLIDKGSVAKAEELQQLLGDQVLKRVNQTKGAISDTEMGLFEKWSAAMNKTPEGNVAIFTALKKVEERNRAIARDVQAMRKAGKKATEIQDAINEKILEMPIFDAKDESVLGGVAPAPAGNAREVDGSLPRLPAGWKIE